MGARGLSKKERTSFCQRESQKGGAGVMKKGGGGGGESLSGRGDKKGVKRGVVAKEIAR